MSKKRWCYVVVGEGHPANDRSETVVYSVSGSYNKALDHVQSIQSDRCSRRGASVTTACMTWRYSGDTVRLATFEYADKTWEQFVIKKFEVA